MPPINRRSFLSLTAAAGLATAAGESTAQEQPTPSAPSWRLRPSIAAYSFRKYLPQNGRSGAITLEDFFSLAAEWGLGAVEPTSYYFTSEDIHYLHRLKAKAFALGLDISGTAVRNDFCNPDAAVRDREVTHVKRWVDHSVELGAPVIRIFAGNRNARVGEEQAFQWAVEGMRRASDYAGTRGVFLAIENHGYLTGSAGELLRIVEAVDNEWFGINLDTGNFVADPYENMAKAAPAAINVQLKTDVVAPDGQGRVPGDFGRIVSILRNAGYRGYIALEYEADEDPYTGVPKYLKQLYSALTG